MLVTVGVSGRCLLLLPLRALHLTIWVTSVLSTVINSEGNKDTMGIAHNEEYSKTFGTKWTSLDTILFLNTWPFEDDAIAVPVSDATTAICFWYVLISVTLPAVSELEGSADGVPDDDEDSVIPKPSDTHLAESVTEGPDQFTLIIIIGAVAVLTISGAAIIIIHDMRVRLEYGVPEARLENVWPCRGERPADALRVCHSESPVSGAVRHSYKEVALTKPLATTELDCCESLRDSEVV
ncbi:hypothetical protein F7725_018611, partial [Dissostichus mawsoni]